MRIHRVATVAGLLLMAQVLVPGCITIPTIADRVVELVTTGSTTQSFTAAGTSNIDVEVRTIDINSEVDLAQVIDDAGIDVNDVTKLQVAAVAYRVTRADANSSSRHISGSVQVSCESNPTVDLVNPFNADAGATTGWINVPLATAGVGQINVMLGHLLDQLQGGMPADAHLTYTIIGTSSPTDVATDFDYEIRLTINIAGTVKTQVPTGK